MGSELLDRRRELSVIFAQVSRCSRSVGNHVQIPDGFHDTSCFIDRAQVQILSSARGRSGYSRAIGVNS